MKGGREREGGGCREGIERKEGKLTGSAPLLPSAIKEVRTRRGGGRGGENTGPMLRAQLYASPNRYIAPAFQLTVMYAVHIAVGLHMQSS